jgi:tetratricopeptide (TPR) repeat protein
VSISPDFSVREFAMRTARFLVWVAVAGVFAGPVAVSAPAPAEPTEAELKEKAIKLNKETTTLEAADAKLKELLKDKKATAALVKAAAKIQRDAKEGEKPFRFYAGLVLGKAAEGVKNYDAADQFYSFCTDNAINDLQSGKLITTAVENQLEFLWGRKKYKEVEDLCDKVLVLDSDRDQTLTNAKFYFLERQIQAIAKEGDTDKALDKAEKLVKLLDGEWFALQIKAWVQREAGKYDDAIKTYKEVVEKIEAVDNPKFKKEEREKLIRNTKYVMSGVFLEADQLDKSTELLQELIKSDSENATYYNDLGFLWCDHDQKLEESEKLIRKAIDLDLKAKKKLLDEKKIEPEDAKKPNPAYADSLGWVLYKLKKYDEALPHLQEAAKDEEEGGHIEIWDHVGDCLLALGKKKDALETFQKALKMDDVSKKDADRRKQVQEKVKKLKAELK